MTFTDKAAGEMRARLDDARRARRTVLDVPLGGARPAALLLRRAAAAGSSPRKRCRCGTSETRSRGRTASGPRPTSRPRSSGRRTAASSRTTTSRSLGDHEPPIPPDLMVRVYREYERRKAEQGWVDFEDLLELTIRLFDADEGALEQVRDRYRAFTVDEYQDVNLLQQTLLDRWLGDRDELCAVGDDYQSIYAFTGASPELPARRCRGGSRVRPSSGSRRTTARPPRCSSSRTGSCRGSAARRRSLRATRPAGPEPVAPLVRQRPSSRPASSSSGSASCTRTGRPYEEMAILFRTNARSADFEEALTRGRDPVRRARRSSPATAARQFLKALRGRPLSDAAADRPSTRACST